MSPAVSVKLQGETEPCNGLPARLAGRHFLGKRSTEYDCKVCSQHKRKKVEEEDERGEEKKKKTEELDKKTEEMHSEERKEKEHFYIKDCEPRQTSYYCKTCAGEPNLCPVPCFELYHTKVIYKAAPELERQGELTEHQ